MAFSTKITYKNSNNLFSNSFTSSFINPGQNGVDGAEGDFGKSLYFTNYDLSNDYYRDIVLKKISNGMLLSSDADIKLEHRSYVNGDLVLTNDKMVYKIRLDDNKYDIELIGKIQDKNIVQDYKDNILSVNLDIKFCKINVPIISNRSLDASIEINGIEPTTYNESDNTLYCIKVIPSINLIDMSDYNYEFYLKIKLHNTKEILCNEYAFVKGVSDIDVGENKLTTSNNKISFYKNIEFRLTAKDDRGPRSTLDEYIVSDMALDKLHPSGNNIDIKLTQKLINKNGSFIGNIIYENGDYVLDTIECDDVSTALTNTFTNVNNAIQTSLLQSHTYIQYPREIDRYGNCRYNFRAGESSYFSGMIKSDNISINDSVNNYHTSIKNINHDDNYEYVCEHMLDFLLSPENKFELICVNTDTNWSEIVEIGTNTEIKLIINKN